ncbi:low temperature requirement protein A [Humibacter ginsenosidimutans]|uniref:low temperature requirement protein A n=1 Tax=Humibacter ginsenosidimutans TaxID=2599293 RepID=UPI00143D3355|nr:low temperature requirement protein A [Humibacter ginsenosidimutans]
MTSRRPPALGRTGHVASRVSTLELLFDLVFVYAVSQVAEAIVEHPTAVVAVQAAITVGVVWWMYDAYSWLTNQAAEQTLVSRLLLLTAMAAFLVMSLALPDAWGRYGLLFGVSYAVVVVIHAGLFIGRGGTSSVRAMLRVGPLNLLAAASLIAAGFVTGPLDWLFWLLPFVFFAISATVARRVGFALGPAHFVERHGAVMIIVFGESIVSVGAGLARHELPAAVIGAIATVAVVAALWWCYFSGDDERAVRVMEHASPPRRASLGVTAFYVDHLVMIVGLIYLASGLHGSLVDALAVAPAAFVWFIAAGVAVFLLGEAAYRVTLGLGFAVWRLVGAVLALATGLVGLAAPVIVQLAVIVVVVVLMLMVEWGTRGRAATG